MITEHERFLFWKATVPDLATFRRWLEQSGWERIGTGNLGSTYEWRGYKVALPSQLHEDWELAASIATRVASAMELAEPKVLGKFVEAKFDRLDVHLNGEDVTGRVPMNAAWEALRNFRRLMSSAGTSVISPVRSINRRYRAEAQELASKTQLSHTLDGSYVFPFYVPLGSGAPDLYRDTDVVIEPYERRVMRTLATGVIASLELASAEELRELPEERLDRAVSAGLSRELCQSVADLVKNESIESVSLDFVWADSMGETRSLPTHIEIPRSRRPAVRHLAKRLAAPHRDASMQYSGAILEIGHDVARTRYFLVLDTYIQAVRRRLEVVLSPEQHQKAIRWYQDGSLVLVRGEVEQSFEGPRMSAPQDVQAVVADRMF